MLDTINQNPIPADNRKLLVLASVVLASLHVTEFLLHGFLPERVEVGEAAINIYGLILLASTYLVFRFSFIRILKIAPQVKLVYLVVFGCLVVLFAEIICQMVQFSVDSLKADDIWNAFVKIIGQAAISLMVGLPLAIELRYKNKILATVAFFAIGALCWYLIVYLKVFERL